MTAPARGFSSSAFFVLLLSACAIMLPFYPRVVSAQGSDIQVFGGHSKENSFERAALKTAIADRAEVAKKRSATGTGSADYLALGNELARLDHEINELNCIVNVPAGVRGNCDALKIASSGTPSKSAPRPTSLSRAAGLTRTETKRLTATECRRLAQYRDGDLFKVWNRAVISANAKAHYLETLRVIRTDLTESGSIFQLSPATIAGSGVGAASTALLHINADLQLVKNLVPVESGVANALLYVPTAISLIKDGKNGDLLGVLKGLATTNFRREAGKALVPWASALGTFAIDMKKAVDNSRDWSEYHDEFTRIINGLDTVTRSETKALANSHADLESMQPLLDAINTQLKACR